MGCIPTYTLTAGHVTSIGLWSGCGQALCRLLAGCGLTTFLLLYRSPVRSHHCKAGWLSCVLSGMPVCRCTAAASPWYIGYKSVCDVEHVQVVCCCCCCQKTGACVHVCWQCGSSATQCNSASATNAHVAADTEPVVFGSLCVLSLGLVGRWHVCVMCPCCAPCVVCCLWLVPQEDL